MATYLVNRLHESPHLARHRYYDVFDLTTREVGGELVARSVARDLRDRYGDVGLVVGGPPCQGYSGIGHRRTFTGLIKVEIPSNHLYRDMATIIREVRPRAFLFENVKGLLTSKWTVDGTNGEIWNDVRRTFEGIDGYYVNWKLVHANQHGVPQNRPRVLLVGIRDDLGFRPRDDEPAGGLLPRPEGRPPDPVEFLGDLEDPAYLSRDATEMYPRDAQNAVQEEFRRDFATRRIAMQGDRLTEHEYSRHADRIRGEVPVHARPSR